MYEQVSRGIQLICCLAAASLKFISFATFVVAVDGVDFNFNRHFHLQSTLLLTQNYLTLSCQCGATSPKFVAINGIQLKLSIVFMETISLQSCGYYFWSCGYGIILWIVDTILFQVERLQSVGTTLIQNALS